jgi:hypothetical protein
VDNSRGSASLRPKQRELPARRNGRRETPNTHGSLAFVSNICRTGSGESLPAAPASRRGLLVLVAPVFLSVHPCAQRSSLVRGMEVKGAHPKCQRAED